MFTVNHSWLYGSVKPYFEKHGIKLLKDDMLFIERCLSNVPQERQKNVMRDYFNLFNAEGTDKEKDKKTGVNYRYEANCYLRSVSGVKSLTPP